MIDVKIINDGFSEPIVLFKSESQTKLLKALYTSCWLDDIKCYYSDSIFSMYLRDAKPVYDRLYKLAANRIPLGQLIKLQEIIKYTHFKDKSYGPFQDIPF